MIGAMEDDVLYPEIQPNNKRLKDLKDNIDNAFNRMCSELEYDFGTEFSFIFPESRKEEVINLMVDIVIKEGVYELE